MFESRKQWERAQIEKELIPEYTMAINTRVVRPSNFTIPNSIAMALGKDNNYVPFGRF